ncbi:hypothetical protein L1277_003093 [Okibacterium sp. HSC-33S16]|uniref:hypothetical protein n=1 Tax=Okibacterium sp. HSC-33S16 TaxID=2910965 RepID=UPI00209D7BBF|nr:hypothetical protein [Okibacterium sp. HSC-33S16]MCP2032980.1 hypothetical protein [Okibacterium sp. HSC-33S16]
MFRNARPGSQWSALVLVLAIAAGVPRIGLLVVAGHSAVAICERLAKYAPGEVPESVAAGVAEEP